MVLTCLIFYLLTAISLRDADDAVGGSKRFNQYMDRDLQVVPKGSILGPPLFIPQWPFVFVEETTGIISTVFVFSLHSTEYSPRTEWYPSTVLMVSLQSTAGIPPHYLWYPSIVLMVSSTVLVISSTVLMIYFPSIDGILIEYWWYLTTVLLVSLHCTESLSGVLVTEGVWYWVIESVLFGVIFCRLCSTNSEDPCLRSPIPVSQDPEHFASQDRLVHCEYSLPLSLSSDQPHLWLPPSVAPR